MNNFLALEKKNQMISIFIILILIVSLGYYFGNLSKSRLAYNNNKSGIISDQNENINNDELLLIVNIKGAVKNPGIYEFPDKSRVNDAVLKAIPLEKADLVTLNLAMFLQDEQDIYIPFIDDDESTEEKKDKLTSINKADEDELENVPGIGPVMAKNIIIQRDKIGRFQSIEALLNVSGIGEKTLEKMRPYIKL